MILANKNYNWDIYLDYHLLVLLYHSPMLYTSVSGEYIKIVVAVVCLTCLQTLKSASSAVLKY